jgi:carbamoyl-phosphate synthase large subunit
MRKVTVLVTAAGSAPALAFIRGLRAQRELEVTLVGVDGVPHSFGLFECDHRYTVPRVKDPAFLDALEAICRRHAVDVLAPILDFELDLFAAPETAARLANVRLISNSAATVALARDKRAATAKVAEAGVAVPEVFATPEVFADAAAASVRYPLVVKPTVGAGSVGVSIVRTAAELPAALAAAGAAPLLQEFVDGDEYTVDLVVAPDGVVLAACPRQRVEIRGGQSYKGRTVDDEDVASAARRAARALGMTGQGNVQLLRATSGGPPKFIELNPKFAAGMGLTIGAGLNLPLVYVKLALGLPVGASELTRRADVWMLRAWEERYVDASAIAEVPPWTHARS